MEHGTERRDPCAGSNENRIAHGRAQDEIAEWPLTAYFLAFFHVAKKIGHEAVLHAVQTQGELVAVRRRGSDGVGAGDLFAIGFVGFEGEPLSGNEPKSRDALHFEFKMLGQFGERHGAGEFRSEGLERHWLFR